METEGRALASVRLRLAAIAAAHRLGGHEDPTTRPLVKATMKRLAREYGKPRKQAKWLTSEALAAVKATARIQRVDSENRPCGRVDGPERACTGLEVGFSPHPQPQIHAETPAPSPVCRKHGAPADAGGYCRHCTDEILVRSFRPLTGGCRKKGDRQQI